MVHVTESFGTSTRRITRLLAGCQQAHKKANNNLVFLEQRPAFTIPANLCRDSPASLDHHPITLSRVFGSQKRSKKLKAKQNTQRLKDASIQSVQRCHSLLLIVRIPSQETRTIMKNKTNAKANSGTKPLPAAERSFDGGTAPSPSFASQIKAMITPKISPTTQSEGPAC